MASNTDMEYNACVCDLSGIDRCAQDFRSEHVIKYSNYNTKPFGQEGQHVAIFDANARRIKTKVQTNDACTCYLTVTKKDGTEMHTQFDVTRSLPPECKLSEEEPSGKYHCVLLNLKPKDSLYKKIVKEDFRIIVEVSRSPQFRSYCDDSMGDKKACSIKARCLSALSTSLKSVSDFEAEHTITLVVGEKQLIVNKSILCAHSPVFKQMFLTPTEGKAENSIEMPMALNIVQELIAFLYAGTVGNLDEGELMELYKAADRYQMEHLRKQCRQQLTRKLHAANACKQLGLAHEYKDSEFMKSVAGFMRLKRKAVLESDNWQELMRKNPKLALHDFD